MFVGAEKRTNLNIPLLFILQQGMLFIPQMKLHMQL